jgi:rSAM/selenodomain-associated transferase 1
MTKSALIVFVKNPVAGKVKTRLAASIGAEKALEVYLQLSQRIYHSVQHVDADCFVYYAENEPQTDLWDGFEKRVQVQGTLGDRMKAAIGEVLKEGYSEVILMGSDIYGLTSDVITDGLEKLLNADVVLGPAEDGGYYLIGMSRLISAPFSLADWSQSEVLRETLNLLKAEGMEVSLLETLRDIDYESDLEGTDLLF